MTSTPAELSRVDCFSPRQTSRASATLQGGQVLSWLCDGQEQLFVSPLTSFRPGQAIRGGIPVIFPQFGTRGPGLRHGFARLRSWELAKGDSPFALQLDLRDDAASREIWPHRFEARLTVCLPAEDRLCVELAVTNTGNAPCTFTAALHTYLRVSDISRISLHGLQGCAYLDAVYGGRRGAQEDAALRFSGETDRVYLNPPSSLVLEDGHSRRTLQQAGFADTVVWNPGETLATTMPDLGAGGHRHFVCVEAACVERPVVLAPGESWRGSQTMIR